MRKTLNDSVFWHGRPTVMRWNTGGFSGSTITKKLFLDIAREGTFKFYLEPNTTRPFSWSNLYGTGYNVEGVMKISKPDVIAKCFN